MSFSWSNKRHDKQPQGLSRQQRGPASRQAGQNMTEYMLVFAAAVAVMVVALNPKGFVTKSVSKSINMMFDSVEDMTREPCLGTIDDVNGGWSNWSSWGACAGCVQTRTRGCTNPSPKCNGSPCSGPVTETQPCLSGTWVTGICGACTGDCGDTNGTCTRLVTCLGGCCAPPAPASVLTCTKAEFPDEWNWFDFGSCSTTCDEGIASRTVQCSGMCCDALLKPHTRRACTDGCCAETLYAYTDVGTSPGPEDDTLVNASFGFAANGEDYSVSCPFGYDGSPTRTCTATANLSCTGNDSYVPPPSCYNIGWSDPVLNTCVPAACEPSGLVDIGYGGHTLMYEFGGTNHGGTATVDCTTLTDPNTGAKHTGYLGQPASYECWTKTWRNLNATCIPNCPAQTLDVGSGQTGEFLETVDGAIRNSSCPCGYASVSAPQRQCDEAGNNLGQWGNLIPGTECTLKQCPKETFSVVPEPPVTGDFGPVNHLQTSTLDCSSQIDSRFEGSVSRDCDWCTYDTNNGWGPQQGACSAKGCGPSGSYDIGGGLWASFDPIGHGQTQTINCNSKNNTYTGTATLYCEYGNWIDSTLNAGCRPFACQTTYVSPPVGNAASCGDDTSLTANEYWSVVDDCTPIKTCEWACDATFKKFGNNCEDTECYDPAPGGAVWCGTQKPLVDTKRWLSSTCTTNTMCEYQCDSDSSYVYYNGTCCHDVCPIGSCGTQTVCGKSKDCGSCCGNGAIDAGEQCDGGSSSLPANSWQCTTYNTYYGSSYNGGTLSCKSDCTFNTSSCCYSADGGWSDWSNSGNCGDYNSCQQYQTRSCTNPAPYCGGAGCSGVSDQYISCTSDFCCGNGCNSGLGETCSNCADDCGACCGNNYCGDSGEDCSTCPADCGACCGNGSCDDGNGGRPDYDESCSTCSADCGTGGVWSRTGASSIVSKSCSGTSLVGQSCCPLGSTTTNITKEPGDSWCRTISYECKTNLTWQIHAEYCMSEQWLGTCKLTVGAPCTPAWSGCDGCPPVGGCPGGGCGSDDDLGTEYRCY